MAIKIILPSLILLGMGLTAAGVCGYKYYWANARPGFPEPRLVSVHEGSSLSTVATDLQRAGVINSALMLRFYAEFSGQTKFIKPGDYAFKGGEPVSAVLAHLVNGDAMLVTIAIPEGQTVHQIAQRLDRKGLVCDYEFEREARQGRLVNALGLGPLGAEGYLFPATYRLSPLMSGSQILEAMLMRFFQAWNDGAEARRADLGITTNEVVTLASIVEKEAKVAGERPLIAGVFYNRLRLNMPLQSDPTAQYNFNDAATPAVAAVHADSPFNTYDFAGFPPGPIANPGWSSIESALYPKATGYLYFVARNDGTHVFSRSLREHDLAIIRLRKDSRQSTESTGFSAVSRNGQQHQ